MRRLIRPLTQMVFRAIALGARKGPHVTRYSMYRTLAEHKEPDVAGKRVLSISGSVDLCKVVGFSEDQIEDTAYPDVSILSLPYKDNEFDALICDQVLEHVDGDPQVAFSESFRVVKPGGLVIQATCLVMPVHMAPYDFWRFTPYGLKRLAEPHGEVITIGGWGHPSIVLLDALGLRHEPIPEAWWHPGRWIATANRESWPVVTWVVARKPTS